MKKITISGLAGSGKSTIGKLLANELEYNFISAGNISRQFALEHYSVDINRFQQICSEHPEIDLELDKYFGLIGQNQANFVMDYRLGSLFIKDGFHIILQVSDLEAAKRIRLSDRGGEFESDCIEDKAKILNKRNQMMRERFIKLYNYDFTNERNYNLVIDTNNKSPKDILNYIQKILC